MSSRFHPLLRLLIATVGAIVAQVAVASVIGAALLVAAQIAHRPLTDSTDFANRNQLLLVVLVYPPTLLWLWFCRRAFDRQTFASLGLRARGAFSGLMWGASCGVLTLSLLFGIFVTCGFVHVHGFSPEWQQNSARSLLYLMAYALAFCCVGVTEEIIFRGYVFHNLTAWMGVRAALWAQAIGFGLVHLGNVITKLDASGAPTGTLPVAQWPHAFWDARWGVLNIALIGVFFALSYLKTGSLWFPIGFHAAWDFCLGCIFSLPVSGIPTFHLLNVSLGANRNATGGSFGAEGSIFLVAIIVAMLWLMRREKDDPQALNDLALLNSAVLGTLNSASAADETSSSNTESGTETTDDDLTHIPRFRTSMRPSSPRPALELGRSGLDLSSTRSGFSPAMNAPQNSTTADALPVNVTLATTAPLSPAPPLSTSFTPAMQNAALESPSSSAQPTTEIVQAPVENARETNQKMTAEPPKVSEEKSGAVAPVVEPKPVTAPEPKTSEKKVEVTKPKKPTPKW